MPVKPTMWLAHLQGGDRARDLVQSPIPSGFISHGYEWRLHKTPKRRGLESFKTAEALLRRESWRRVMHLERRGLEAPCPFPVPCLTCLLTPAVPELYPFTTTWCPSKWNVSLNSVNHSSKLVEAQREVLGTSDSRQSAAQLTTWNCNWHLKWVWGWAGHLAGLSLQPVVSDAISGEIVSELS